MSSGPPNEVLKLAYDAVRGSLQQQDTTLANLRNRATGLIAAAAVGTSVAAGVGLFRPTTSGGQLPVWAGWTLLILTILIGVSVLLALWPIREWSYGPSAARLLASSSLDINDVHRQASLGLIAAEQRNAAALAHRFRAYRAGTVLLMIETAVLIAALLTA